jgi:hypothetical protein
MSTSVIRNGLVFLAIITLTACGGRSASVAITAVSNAAMAAPVATEQTNTPIPASDAAPAAATADPTATPSTANQGDDESVPSQDCKAVRAMDVKSMIGQYTQRLNDASSMDDISGIETDCSYVADDISEERSIYVAIYRRDQASAGEWNQYWLQKYTSSDNPAPDLALGYYANGSLTISKGDYCLVVTIKTPETKDKANQLGALEKGFALKVLASLPIAR